MAVNFWFFLHFLHVSFSYSLLCSWVPVMTTPYSPNSPNTRKTTPYPALPPPSHYIITNLQVENT
ncbi:hypothetical protein M758_1G014200 [Ceratodon purpureus]|uniref:Uncharacterized protein n=1 Tax=Ceratodon purpureus TaxID=3225 RepID=A0A8T0J1C7_CERPU|nr:hypothetical protein KC19_1G014900 [Ceratodon purpureus]KAG0628267.1 hypothetical protein M758_1G014200 [Ceratodon purpureus]